MSLSRVAALKVKAIHCEWLPIYQLLGDTICVDVCFLIICSKIAHHYGDKEDNIIDNNDNNDGNNNKNDNNLLKGCSSLWW